MKTFVVVSFAAFIAGCSAKPDVVAYSGTYSGAGPHRLYVVSHGWHTGLVVPAPPIQAEIPALYQRFSDTPFIEFGWGDKGFYQAKEITTGLTLQAIFWPTASVVHAVAVPDDVEGYFAHSEVEQLCLTEAELASLTKFLAGSFARTEQGAVVSLKNGIYGNSQFFQGTGDYYLTNTCNKWTAKGLKSIGMDVDPAFKLTAGSVMSYLKNRVKSIGGTGASCQAQAQL
ncbi:TIGR02117 family protein [Marinobacterium jannaschii]|uniref:TIGR02117 family protein n=1 Tax=Marinobacterium jannaschii TaxID=64970 RepID=UPI000483D0A0|nr:TIGR02117 family protein [Marinobacterium jannaschii]